jgi:hypothetical protein
MELKEAIAKASQVLDEERACPTVTYGPRHGASEKSSRPLVAELQNSLTSTSNALLSLIRQLRPRPVQENPRQWTFKSINYDLLRALLGQVAKNSRPALLNGVLLRMSSPACALARLSTTQPCWNSLVSELPLVAEFSVRNGATQQFLNALAEANPSPGHAVLLEHLEDMIALNYSLFSDAEYEEVGPHVRVFRDNAERQLGRHGHMPGTTQQWAGVSVNLGRLLYEICNAADGIQEECRKARYFYLKGALLEGLNLEINQDKDAVQGYLQTLGFTETLAGSLDEAERLYHQGGSAFSLKASMGHLRSFLENLQKDALPALHASYGGEVPGSWGAGLTYLRKNEVLSVQEEKFAGSLYAIISDEAVHPLVAERECARLIRNVVIEYALLFLRKLDKLGLKRP